MDEPPRRDRARLHRPGLAATSSASSAPTANPGELIWEAVAYGAPRAEFGWGHAIASLTDCLAMVDHYDDDDRALPIVQAIAGVAETERGRPVRPLPDPLAMLPARATCRVPPARRGRTPRHRPGRRCGAPSTTVLTADELRPWFTDVVADHLLSYGHGAIYTPEGVPAPRPDRVGPRRHRAAVPRADDRVRHPRGQVAVHEAVPSRDGATRSGCRWPSGRTTPTRPGSTTAALLAALLGEDRTEAALAAGAAIAAGAIARRGARRR